MKGKHDGPTWWRIVQKEMNGLTNRWTTLAAIYVFYFISAWFALRPVLRLSLSDGLSLILLAAFLIQTGMIIAFMLLPGMVYAESMKGMHEAYFAYGFTLRGLVAGKALVIALLSVLPAMLFAALALPSLMPCGWLFVALGIAVTATVFGIACMIVFCTWFSRIGRFSAVVLMLVIVVGFSRFRGFGHSVLWVEPYTVLLILLGIGAGSWMVFVVASGFASPENQLLRR